MSFSLTTLATDLISNLGYGGLTIGLLLDSFGVPIPSEVLIPVSTILAQAGRFNLYVVFIIGTLAQVAGGLLSYYIGRVGGLPAAEKFGRYILVSRHDLERTHEVFLKYGRLMAVVGRCLPVIRGLVGYPAGIAKMPVVEFAVFTTIGSAIWTGVLMYLGIVLSQHLELIDSFMNKFSIVIVVLLVIAVIYHFRHAIAEQRERMGSKKGTK
jgi:membrane protein DedA with SNARE-associated domain